MMYRAVFYRSGVLDPVPTWKVGSFGYLLKAVENAQLEIAAKSPDVTEVAILDDNDVQWYRYRYRLDNPQENTDEL